MTLGTFITSASIIILLVLIWASLEDREKTFKKTEHVSALRQRQVSNNGNNFAFGKNPKTKPT